MLELRDTVSFQTVCDFSTGQAPVRADVPLCPEYRVQISLLQPKATRVYVTLSFSTTIYFLVKNKKQKT